MFKLLKDKPGCVKSEVYLGQDKPLVYDVRNTEISIEVTVRGKSAEVPMPSEDVMEKVSSFVNTMNEITGSGILRILNDGHHGTLSAYAAYLKTMGDVTGRN